MATIGQALLEPESGWKRYDDTDPSIKYEGNKWVLVKHDYDFNKTAHVAEKASNENKIKFNFKGTKLRLFSYSGPDRSGNLSIEIDNIIETFSQNKSDYIFQELCYEKTGLPNKIHTVVITVGTGRYNILDAIDIDEDGRLLNPDEITSKILFERLGEFYTYNKEDDTIQSLGIISGEERLAFIKENGLENITPDILNRVKTSAINKSKIVISDY